MQYAIDMQFDFSSRDESLGVLGTIKLPMDSVYSSDQLDDARLHAFAHVGKFPEHSLYITDGDGRVYEIVLNQHYHERIAANSKSIFVAWACFSMSMIGLVGASVGGIGPAGLVFALVGISVYLLSVKTGTFNEVESLVIALVIAVLATMLIPALGAMFSSHSNAC